MLREPTFEKLYSLKLHGMAQAFEQQLANPDSAAAWFRRALCYAGGSSMALAGKPGYQVQAAQGHTENAGLD